MARFVYRTLIPASSHSSAALGFGLSSRARLIWSQAAEPSSHPAAAEAEARMVEKIEDLIHSIIVKRSKPDWLPFVPGASYWIPPRRSSYGVAQVINKLSNPLSLSDDDFLSLTTLHPLPSSHFYLHEDANESTSTLDLAEEKTSSTSPLVSEEPNLSSAEISAESNSPLDPAEQNLSSTETSTDSMSPLDSAEGEPLLTNPAPKEEEET